MLRQDSAWNAVSWGGNGPSLRWWAFGMQFRPCPPRRKQAGFLGEDIPGYIWAGFYRAALLEDSRDVAWASINTIGPTERKPAHRQMHD